MNEITHKDTYPIPRIDDTLAGSKCFSTLDLKSGYWQVEVDPQHREKTAFCTHEGLFQFNVMLFGLCNAPATLQLLMDMVLTGLQWNWAKSLLFRMGYVKHKACSREKVEPSHYEQLKEQYLLDIKVAVEMGDIPADQILNWDHTGINIVPWTLVPSM